jgi:hypothetical protein
MKYSHCFIAGTKITMADGSQKNIESVEVGDMVMSFNESSNQQESKSVLETSEPIHSDLVRYIFDKLLISGDNPVYLSLTCTHDTPIYINGLNLASYNPSLTYQRYNLGRPILATETDNVVNLNDGETITLFGLQALPNVERQTYNLTVEDNHNFYANTILVHDN